MRSAAELGAGLRGAGRWLSRALVEPRLPLLALEVRPQALAAVRLGVEGGRLTLGAAAAAELAPGVVEVSLTKANVIELPAFRAALRAVLERVGALSGGPLSLVLPDPAIRIALLPAAGLRGHGREAEETLRFRLHKVLPFDVRGARLAWTTSGEQLLVAVTPDEVVRGYEEALEGLGYHVGLVEATSLALIGALAGQAPALDRLLVNWDAGYVSLTVLRGDEPLLVRTLVDEDNPEAVARHVTSTLQFHRDRLGGQGLPEVVLRSAAVPAEQALAVLERALGASPQLLRPWAALGITDDGSGAHAVAGAAACVLRRAA